MKGKMLDLALIHIWLVTHTDVCVLFPQECGRNDMANAFNAHSRSAQIVCN